MKSLGISILFLLTILTDNSCKKQSTEADLMVNDMTATINGVAWKRTSCFSGCQGGGSGLVVQFFNNNLYVSGQQDNLLISINIYNIVSTGTYSLSGVNSTSSYGFYLDTKDNSAQGLNNNYKTNNQYTGTVNITKFDTATKTIQGTFSFDGESIYNSGAIVHVTDGKFNVQYQ